MLRRRRSACQGNDERLPTRGTAGEWAPRVEAGMALKLWMAEDSGMYDDGGTSCEASSDVSVSLDVDGEVPL